MKGSKNNSGLAVAGAVVAAITASLCCILPAVATTLGIAGIAAAGWFAPSRPYLLGLTFGLLGAGFYLAYRAASPAACEPGSTCAPRAVSCWNRRFLWVAAVLVIVLAAFPYYSERVARAVSKPPSLPATLNAATARVLLRIEGMDCPMCAAGLQSRLREIPGVCRAEVSFQDKQAILEYDPSVADPSRFTQVVAQAGFRVATDSAATR